jgi:biopolymer transport protein ExbB/TolQ
VLFSPLRVGLWLFPVLGFLGTIIGISAAIEKLPEAMRERGAQLTGVVNELHFAFDTTFLGLIAAIVLMFITALTASLWERNEALSRGRAGDRPE